MIDLNQRQREYIQLWYLLQHSLSAFYKLQTHFSSVSSALEPAHLLQWSKLGLHKNHLERLQEFSSPEGQKKFQQCLMLIEKHCDFICLDNENNYPKQLLAFSDHPPILFGKGSLQNLSQPQVAVVGSRKPSSHGKQVAFDFAYYLSEKGYFITSGLAQGIDEAAHMGALKKQRAIAVVGTGLDMVYPNQNAPLQEQILENAGTVISEFLPTTKPLQQHFPRRNRIVSGLSLGVLVAEAAQSSGSLITAKLAAEQGKIVFAIPGHIYSEYHKGCHQLIREGAILVDHPEQIIEDLALPAQWQKQGQLLEAAEESEEISDDHSQEISQPISQDMPEHLFNIYQELDWIGIEIDQLAAKLNFSIAELTSHLMELELLGLCIQQSGLYLRCRKLY